MTRRPTGALVLLVAAMLLPAPRAAAAQRDDPLARASAAMAAGRFEEAAAIYRELLRRLPGEAGLLMNLGMALAMGGDEAAAIDPLEAAVKKNPSLVPAQLFLGTTRLALGRPREAVAPLERVVRAQPTNLDARRVLAQAYAGAGLPAKAIGELRRITAIAPGNPQAWYTLGQAYNAIAQESLASFDRDPADAPWRRLLVGDALAADGRFTDAFAIYREMQPQLPQMVSIHDGIARIYEATTHRDWAAVERARGALTPAACAKRQALCAFRAGRHQAALAAALAGTDPESRYWQVRAATELALDAFRRLEALPDSRERRASRGALARAARRYTDAVAEYEAALTFAPDDPELLEELGTAQYLARAYDAAIATLGPLAKVQVENATLQAVYGQALLELQRLDEAVPALALAVGLDPANQTARAALARAYVQQGEHAAAIPLLESLLATDTDGSLHLQLARAHTAQGDRARAAPLIEKGRQLQQASQDAAAAASSRAITPPG
jgi:tetratricopeptide (TPR) repeat protein